jgi:hypothetical protein
LAGIFRTRSRTGPSIADLLLFPGSRLTTVKADRDGWARSLHGSDFVYADAPGYSPLWCGLDFCCVGLERYEPWRFGTRGLVPGHDVPIEVRDFLDRPLAGARVEVRLSEAGEDGRATVIISESAPRCAGSLPAP